MSTTESSMRLRPMAEPDLDTVLEIERRSFTAPWSATSFQSLLRRDDADLFVADEGGAVVGYAVLWHVAGESELGNLAVAPEWRRRGLGGRLLDRAVRCASRRGSRRIYLEVRPSNQAAQRLYTAYGFHNVGRRRRYYRSPVEDAMIMCRDLDARGE